MVWASVRSGAGEQGEEEAIVVDPFLADLLAMVETRLDHPLDRPLPGGRAQAVGTELERRLPGDVEAGRVGAAAQAAGALLAHPDPRRRLPDDAAIGERLDEGALPGGRPPVLAVLEIDGLEGEAGGGRIGPAGIHRSFLARGRPGEVVLVMFHTALYADRKRFGKVWGVGKRPRSADTPFGHPYENADPASSRPVSRVRPVRAR